MEGPDIDVPSLGSHFDASAKDLKKHEPYTPMELEGLAPGPDGLSHALWQSTGVGLEDGHVVRRYVNGEVFDALVEAIGRARHHVHLLLYIWRPSPPSDRIVEALLAARARGVQVRVVVDPIGSEAATGKADFDRAVEPVLTRAGCEVHYYRLLAKNALGRLFGRTHQKLVVVDGTLGFTGGFGIWKVWEGHGRAEEEWRDTAVRVEGPAVRQFQLAFARSWQEAGGRIMGPELFPLCKPCDGGTVRAGFVASIGAMGLTDADRMYRMCIATAQRRLWIANAYFSPPNAMLEQLEYKARHGVDVRVLAPGPVHDQKIVRASQRSVYPRLLRAGVRIFEYRPSMMHSKTLLADDWLAMIGSCNLDSLSLNKLAEGSLVMADRETNAALAHDFVADMEVCNEMRVPPRWKRTGPLKRLSRRITQAAGADR